MKEQKFMPEGWQLDNILFTQQSIENACKNGAIMQALVTKCDSNYRYTVRCK